MSESRTDFNLAQIHLIEAVRGRLIGTRLISDLIARARRVGKTVSLSMPRNNQAASLYRRLGFQVVKDDGSSIIHMLWDGIAGN